MKSKKYEQKQKQKYYTNIKDINSHLDSVSKLVLGLKKKRKSSEKIENQLSKRKAILNNEETKALKQLKLEKKNKINKEKIKVNLLRNKELLEKKKLNDQINLKNQKSKNNIMKKEIDNSLKNWKISVKTKNKEGADKLKEQRKIIESIRLSGRNDMINMNKKKHDLIIYDHLQSEEKRKLEEYHKKLKIKKILENKIKKEIDLKQFFDNKIDRQNRENEELIKRIKDHNPEFEIAISSERKRRKSCKNLKTKISFKKI